jgi:hypothetical protein
MQIIKLIDSYIIILMRLNCRPAFWNEELSFL